ncbi:hypothetical protein CYMTET_32573 [Cymbomonas tetramitiformis]|uniref:DUF1995 domain-containing protein n=1 Tax=Cymbomonas tetramitiformis TaxID=36881 RepID=A0AAE0KS24_9CHLO|nr:hypothetical protein CYMTET_32573 [Cymbomonas tetramitiformis]
MKVLQQFMGPAAAIRSAPTFAAPSRVHYVGIPRSGHQLLSNRFFHGSSTATLQRWSQWASKRESALRLHLATPSSAPCRRSARSAPHITAMTGAPPETKQAAMDQVQAALEAQIAKGVKHLGQTAPSEGFATRSRKKAKKNATKVAKGLGQRFLVEVPLQDESAAEYTELLLGILDGLDFPVMLYTSNSACASGVISGGLPHVTVAALEDSVQKPVPGGTRMVLVVNPSDKHLVHVRRVTAASSCPSVILNAQWDPDNVASLQQPFVETFEVNVFPPSLLPDFPSLDLPWPPSDCPSQLWNPP